MKLIAHRGQINGPDPSLANNPATIQELIRLGYDCEVDVWFENSSWYLGHDKPQYKVSEEFINQSGLWLHCKNIGALGQLVWTPNNYFWHQTDDYTITSHKFIWAYPGKQVTDRTVMVMPEFVDPSFDIVLKTTCVGVCSDYIALIKVLLNP